MRVIRTAPHCREILSANREFCGKVKQSLSVPAALVPAPSKAPVLQEPCLVLVSPAFPRSYSVRLFMAEILHGSCLSFSMRTGMFIHLTKTSMNSLPLKGKIHGEKNPG